MRHEVVFTVPGAPQGKARPRFVTRGRGGQPLAHPIVYTPKKTVQYEALIRECFLLETHRILRLDCPIELEVKAYYQIPKSASKKKRAAMLSGEIWPTKAPDADNVLKVVADALNKVAYEDDKQIVIKSIVKKYGEPARVMVYLRWEDDKTELAALEEVKE